VLASGNWKYGESEDRHALEVHRGAVGHAQLASWSIVSRRAWIHHE